MNTLPKRTLSVAPMLDWTDRHYRYMARQITRHTWLYTEMVNAGAIVFGDPDRFLARNECENPVALQLGGSEPNLLAQAARKAAGAAVKAVDMVMRKQAKNAFCAVRPPGHHAHADKASGFCFINNVAVAAMHLIAEYRLERVAILDFDVHHGDGTQDIFADDPRVMLLSSFEYPLYPFAEGELPAAAGRNPHIVNTPLKAGDGSQAFRDAVRNRWLPALEAFRPQFILLSAGFDAHKDDELAHLRLTEDDFEWLTKKIMLLANRYAKGRIVSVLEGGYHLPSLAASAKAHIGCLVKASPFF